MAGCRRAGGDGKVSHKEPFQQQVVSEDVTECLAATLNLQAPYAGEGLEKLLKPLPGMVPGAIPALFPSPTFRSESGSNGNNQAKGKGFRNGLPLL